VLRPIAVLAAALLAASACSTAAPTTSSAPQQASGPAATATTTAATTSTSAATTSTSTGPAPALAPYVAGLSHVVRASGPVTDGGAIIAVAARQLSATGREVDVLSWSGAAWATTAALPLTYPYYTLAPDLPVQVADVTGDGRPDFLVRVAAGDNEPGVVVSADGGAWRLVPLAISGPPSPGDVYAGRDPSFVEGHLVTRQNDCTPD